MTRILLVEDEPVIAAGVRDDLELEGYSVEVVTDGAAASERGAKERFDLILLDVMLPKKDGFAVCRELRAAGVRAPSAPSVCEFGGVRIDFGRCEATKGGQPIDLTAMELKILKTLLDRAGQVVTIDELNREVWGEGVFISDRVVYTHMNNLRSKLEPDPQKPRHILTVRGIGYRLDI